MAEPLTSPAGLLAARLRRQLWIEQQLARGVLPRLVEQAHSPDLRIGLERHLGETERHAEALQRLLVDLGAPADPEESLALAGLVAEHERLVALVGDDALLLDLVHAHAAAATEHLELAAYQALASLADALGEEKLATALRELAGQEEFALEQVEKAVTKLLAEKVEAERVG